MTPGDRRQLRRRRTDRWWSNAVVGYIAVVVSIVAVLGYASNRQHSDSIRNAQIAFCERVNIVRAALWDVLDRQTILYDAARSRTESQAFLDTLTAQITAIRRAQTDLEESAFPPAEDRNGNKAQVDCLAATP